MADNLLELGSEFFSNWLFDVTPSWAWNWRHLQIIRSQLSRVTYGEISKLMLFLPPRHGKSEMVTIRYSAWLIERDPEMRVIIGAYNQTLANKFSRKVRRIVGSRLELSSERTAVEDWETAQGGGLRAIGVGGGITGHGGDLIIIDDPVKNREEANSPTYRNKVWEWYTDDLYTRREPGASMVLINTRWHEDDLAGRILSSDDGPNWTVVSLPAIAEGDDWREIGQALCPERYDVEALADIKTAIGGRAFTALYQQRPMEWEGGMFSRSDFNIVSKIPDGTEFVRYWDYGATQDGGDETAGVKLGRTPANRYIVADVRLGQWSTHNRDSEMMATAAIDGASVPIWIEEEPGSSGKDRTAYIARAMAGFALRGDRVTGSKEIRAEPFAAQVEAGNVDLLRAPWNMAYIDELCTFPAGAQDGMVDASSGAFDKVANRLPAFL